MGTARDFDGILKSELNIHAAWLPIANNFGLGDYGLISDGVLVKMGNIRSDFGVSFMEAPSPGLELNFTTKGTSTFRFVGGASVDAFPDNDVEAKLSVEFKRQNSFLLKALLTVNEIQDLYDVAVKLNALTGWQTRFRVVSATYIGRTCAIISSKSADSKIELSGKAKALRQFDLGSASAEIQASVKKEIGLDLLGEKGVVGLGMFKLGWWTGRPKTLGPGDKVPIEKMENWPESIPDDI